MKREKEEQIQSKQKERNNKDQIAVELKIERTKINEL